MISIKLHYRFPQFFFVRRKNFNSSRSAVTVVPLTFKFGYRFGRHVVLLSNNYNIHANHLIRVIGNNTTGKNLSFLERRRRDGAIKPKFRLVAYYNRQARSMATKPAYNGK